MRNIKREGFRCKNRQKCKQIGFFNGRFPLLSCSIFGPRSSYLFSMLSGLQTQATFVMLLMISQLRRESAMWWLFSPHRTSTYTNTKCK